MSKLTTKLVSHLKPMNRDYQRTEGGIHKEAKFSYFTFGFESVYWLFNGYQKIISHTTWNF